MFSIAGDDDIDVEEMGNPGQWNTVPLGGVDGEPPQVEVALDDEAREQYERIQAEFERFKSRQLAVERFAAQTLAGLDTRMRVPSSAASSECGDSLSFISSEWDSESLGRTEDGLSILGSRVCSRATSRASSRAETPSGSPPGSPREGSLGLGGKLLLQSAEWRTPPKVLQAAARARHPERSGGSSSSSAHAFSSLDLRRLSAELERPHGRGTGYGGGERGDLRGHSAGRAPLSSSANGVRSGSAASGCSIGGGGGEEAAGAAAAAAAPPRLTRQALEAHTGPPQRKGGDAPGAEPDLDMLRMRAAPAAGSEAEQVLEQRRRHAPEEAPEPDIIRLEPPVSAPAPAPAPTAGREPLSPVGGTHTTVGELSMSEVGWQSPRTDASTANERLPQFGSPGALADQAMPAAATDDDVERMWQGWQIMATSEGRMYFHHAERQLSTWQQPEELNSVLGVWEELVDESQPTRPRFWRNDKVGCSCWKDPRLTTNIFQACLDANIYFMHLYADIGGDLDVVDSKGRNPMHYAASSDMLYVVMFLLQKQVEVNRQDENLATPLHFACRYGNAPIVKVLLEGGADPSIACDGGNTVIHEAAAVGELTCLQLLLEVRADPQVPNDEGSTALDIAAQCRNYACLALMQHSGRPLPPAAAARRQTNGANGLVHSPVHSMVLSSPTGGGAMSSCGLDGRPRTPAGSAASLPLGYAGESTSTESDSDYVEEGDAPWEQWPGERSASMLRALGWLPKALDSARRWAFPVQADLGLPNAYRFNEVSKQWELREEA